jgi:hypothetical protein
MKPTLNLGMISKLSMAFLFLSAFSLNLFAQEKQLVIGEQPIYKVAKTAEPMKVDGKMDEAAWKNAQVVSIDNFFRRDKPVDKQASTFRMMWDATNIYLFYEAQDTSLTSRETAFDGRPYLDDCAEFFVLPIPDSLSFHFGFEVNITKARYDYVMLYRYHNNRSFFVKDYNPAYQVESTYDGTINNLTDKDKGWTMEFAIPLDALSNFSGAARPAAGVKWAFQAVRQDRNLVEDRGRSTSTLFPVYVFALDVHQPHRFGIMEFAE